METKRYEIKYVSQRTGLSTHRIRAWERRYNAVEPGRTATDRRIYSEVDIRRLQLLRRAVDGGHRISKISHLGLEELLKLVNRHLAPAIAPSSIDRSSASFDEQDFIPSAFQAIETLNAPHLKHILTRAVVVLSRRRFIEGLIVPLMEQVGLAWVQGRLKIAHEHLASAVIRAILNSMLQDLEGREGDARIVISTPSGQHHELGAIAVALTAADAGWQPIYLGPDLPPEEVATTVEQTGAVAAAISLVSPAHHEILLRQLIKLDDLVRHQAVLFAGGIANPAFLEALSQTTIRWCDSLEAFHFALLDGEALKPVAP